MTVLYLYNSAGTLETLAIIFTAPLILSTAQITRSTQIYRHTHSLTHTPLIECMSILLEKSFEHNFCIIFLKRFLHDFIYECVCGECFLMKLYF